MTEVFYGALPYIQPVRSLAVFAVFCTAGACLWVVHKIWITWERPLVGGPYPLASLDDQDPKQSWGRCAELVVEQALKKYSGPFRIMSGIGPKIILPNRYAHELRSHPHLSFTKATARDLLIHYFDVDKEGLNPDNLAFDIVRKLTYSLNLVTDGLVDEATVALRDIYGQDYAEWRTITLKSTVMDLVARLTSRIFLGLPLCRNPQWLDTAKNFTVAEQSAIFALRMTHPFLRPIASLVMPQMRAVRKLIRETRAIIDPEVQRRKAAVDQALREGGKVSRISDCIGWMYEMSIKKPRRRNDFTLGQLGLSMAAIHTTSEATCVALLAMINHPEVVQPLRDEIIQVIGEHGWHKTSLHKLKAMDSFLRESQRVTPNAIASMGRFVEKEIVLHDGTTLPQGSYVQVAINNMDPHIYPDPEKFDYTRSLQTSAQFVATGPEHLCFGHGEYACPGRFFASNEIKIALCHLLLKYDWRFVPGDDVPDFLWFDAFRATPPELQVQVRRRKEEVNLDIAI